MRSVNLVHALWYLKLQNSQVFCGCIQALSQNTDKFIYFSRLDDQWRGQDHSVPTGAHDRIAFEKMITTHGADASCRGKPFTGLFVLGQFNTTDQTDTANFTYQGVIFNFFQFFGQIWSGFRLRFLHQVFTLDDFDVAQCDRSGDPMTGLSPW